MGPIDIRRLAAIDMHGIAGTQRRRIIITAEFIGGAILGVGIGLVVMLSADSTGWRLFGAYVTAACTNYIPLAIHAISLLRGDELIDELAGASIGPELRRYTFAQLWIAVPFLFLAIAIPQAMGNRPVDDE